MQNTFLSIPICVIILAHSFNFWLFILSPVSQIRKVYYKIVGYRKLQNTKLTRNHKLYLCMHNISDTSLGEHSWPKFCCIWRSLDYNFDESSIKLKNFTNPSIIGILNQQKTPKWSMKIYYIIGQTDIRSIHIYINL